MNSTTERLYTAFAGPRMIASGDLAEVALKIKKHLLKSRDESILIFDDLTGTQTEIDLRGSAEAVVKRIQDQSPSAGGKPTGPGRPKLGVVSREISLLPRHWEWLSLQPGGASVTLRKLIEDAKKKNHPQDQLRQSQNATYKFMTVMAGNLPQFEEALRALYAKNKELFSTLIAPWPKDIRDHLIRLSHAAF